MPKTITKEYVVYDLEDLKKDNADCSVYWLANMIKEIVDSSDLIEEEA